jgi:hypothetical protein
MSTLENFETAYQHALSQFNEVQIIKPNQRKNVFEIQSKDDNFFEWCVGVVGAREKSAEGNFRHAGVAIDHISPHIPKTNLRHYVLTATDD